MLLAAALSLAALVPTEPPAFNSADDLLAALETADAGLERLRADISYDRDFELAGERQTRRGEVFFAAAPADTTHAARRQFCVRFDSLIYDGKTQRDDRQWHIFDGEWYAEKRERDHVMSRKQVVAPGETTDPLKLGEGFFPFPIGQKKSEVLRRYDATLPPLLEGLDDDLKPFVEGAIQLKLVPKGQAHDEFREVRLWYRKGSADSGDSALLLPRLSRVANRSGDVSTVRLINVKANAKADLPPNAFDTSAPKDGWDVKVQSLRRTTQEITPMTGPEIGPETGNSPANPGTANGRAPKPGDSAPSSAPPPENRTQPRRPTEREE